MAQEIWEVLDYNEFQLSNRGAKDAYGVALIALENRSS